MRLARDQRGTNRTGPTRHRPPARGAGDNALARESVALRSRLEQRPELEGRGSEDIGAAVHIFIVLSGGCTLGLRTLKASLRSAGRERLSISKENGL